MTFGKLIEVFLVDGTPDGIVTAEISNWNGVAIKIPRNEVRTCKREDIQETGVYFLLCQEDDGTEAVYVGESENVHKRLLQHLYNYKTEAEPYYWNTAVAFVGQKLNKAHIRYLENHLFQSAKKSGRYKVLTNNTFQTAKLSEAHTASMNEFISNVELLMRTLGYNILEEMPKTDNDTIYLYCKGSGAIATGFVSPGGFTVLRGSTISDHTVKSLETRGKTYYKLRNDLINDGVISGQTFTRDYEFTAPSAASAVILGHTSNGKADWKTEDGKMLKDI